MTKITITLTPQWSKANARAAEHAKAGLRARCLDCRHYEVPSATSGAVYHQTVNSISRLDVECDCPSGRAGRTVCWHKSAAISAAIVAVRAAERARAGRPGEPGSPGRPAGAAAQRRGGAQGRGRAPDGPLRQGVARRRARGRPTTGPAGWTPAAGDGGA